MQACMCESAVCWCVGYGISIPAVEVASQEAEGGGGQSGVNGQIITRNRRLKIVFVNKKYHKNTNNPLFLTEVQVMVAKYIFFK